MAEHLEAAPILDECKHLMTTAFCSLCKAETKAKEKRARLRRAKDHPAWGTEDDLPYPHTNAKHPGRCGECDEDFDEGDTIFMADGKWCCYSCACDFKTLGVGADG